MPVQEAQYFSLHANTKVQTTGFSPSVQLKCFYRVSTCLCIHSAILSQQMRLFVHHTLVFIETNANIIKLFLPCGRSIIIAF